jgi:hypothetical protein
MPLTLRLCSVGSDREVSGHALGPVGAEGPQGHHPRLPPPPPGGRRCEPM